MTSPPLFPTKSCCGQLFHRRFPHLSAPVQPSADMSSETLRSTFDRNSTTIDRRTSMCFDKTMPSAQESAPVDLELRQSSQCPQLVFEHRCFAVKLRRLKKNVPTAPCQFR